MPEETQAVAAPSAAVVEAPSLEIPRSNSPEYVEWRKTGTLPEKKEPEPKNAESLAADTSKETHSEADEAESAPDTDSGKKQQESRRKPGAEARIGELTAKLKQLERDLEEARKPKSTQAESSPARQEQPQQPQTYQDYRKAFKPAEWIEGYAKANPDSSYEEANAAMVDHLADARDYFRQIEQQRQQQANALQELARKAKEKYPDFDEVKTSFLGKVISNQGKPLIPQPVFDIIESSDYLADVVYTIGSDEAEAAAFVEMAKTNPAKAVRYVAKVESLIEAELAKPRNDKGQFAANEDEPAPKTPAKRGPESAPAPPLEINARGSGTMDEAERAFQAIERGDAKAVRAFMAAENAKDLRRRRGV